MKLKNIKINQFGKLKDQEIHFEKPITIIYGKNEAGKSTLLKFITGMFYGVSKNKNKKEISDFEQYEPWQETEFSGKIIYELDNKKRYEVYRDFRKKNPKIYNENSEDISKEYSIDKNRGSEFFKEQTGMEEELFCRTVLAGQEEIKLDKQDQTALIQKMTNLVSSGSDTISYKKTMEKLKNKLWEEVGTDRTTERPINRIEDQLRELEGELEKLEGLNEKQYRLEEIEKSIQTDLEKQEQLVQIVKEIKKQKEEEIIEKEFIRMHQKELNELIEKREKIPNKAQDSKPKKKISFSMIALVLAIAITILLFVWNPNFIINIIGLGLTIALGAYETVKKVKKQKEKQKVIEELVKQKKEQELLEETIEKKQKEITDSTQKLNNAIMQKQTQIKMKCGNFPLEYYFAKEEEEIKQILEKEQEKYSTLKLKWHEAQIEKRNILPQIEKMVQIEERIKALQEEKNELNSLATSIQIAKATIEEAYDEMKGSLTPQFTQYLSESITQISSGKYNNVKFNDEEGLLVEVENGEYKKAERLSTGTISQMYLSLRLAVAKEITPESMPIILDEAFAYYDDERLENALLYLAKNYEQDQILLFTCSNREKEILEKNKVPYQLVEL